MMAMMACKANRNEQEGQNNQYKNYHCDYYNVYRWVLLLRDIVMNQKSTHKTYFKKITHTYVQHPQYGIQYEDRTLPNSPTGAAEP